MIDYFLKNYTSKTNWKTFNPKAIICKSQRQYQFTGIFFSTNRIQKLEEIGRRKRKQFTHKYIYDGDIYKY